MCCHGDGNAAATAHAQTAPASTIGGLSQAASIFLVYFFYVPVTSTPNNASKMVLRSLRSVVHGLVAVMGHKLVEIPVRMAEQKV